MSHQRRIDRLNPALFILVVDQSGSMGEPYAGGGAPKMQVVADQVNELIHDLVLRSTSSAGHDPRPYFSVAVVGYGTRPDGSPLVEDRLPGAVGDRIAVLTTTELARCELRAPVGADAGSAAGSRPEARRPVWVLPQASGGTPTCRAFERAGRLAHTWIAEHPHAFPPVVVHLTDGEPTDGSPELWSRRIRALRTTDGQVLLFNLHVVGAGSDPVLYPADDSELSSSTSRELFAMSSVLPATFAQAARSHGIELPTGARGFAWNADSLMLGQFLSVGTSIGRTLR